MTIYKMRDSIIRCLFKPEYFKIKFIALLLGMCVIFAGFAANAYDKDSHFYVVYSIFRDSGFSPEESTQMAKLDEYIDEHPDTEPSINPSKREQRRTFHFPSGTNFTCPNTLRNSPYAKHNINKGFLSNDEIQLGMALHVYMDSFAHETWGPFIGHAPAGHDPDRPHLDWTKFRQMVRMVYIIAAHYRQINNLPPVAQSISLDQYESWGKYKPPSWNPILPNFNYENTEVSERISEWKKHIKDFIGDEIEYSVPDETLKNQFVQRKNSYSLPGKESGCIDKEWSNPSSGADQVWNFHSKTSHGQKDGQAIDKIVERLKKMKTLQAARYILTHPEIISDSRVKELITTTEGLGALMQLAAKTPGSASQWPYPGMKVISACDWSSVDFHNIVKPYLTSTNFRSRIFAANLLCVFPSAETLGQIGAVYDGINFEKLKKNDRQCLLNTLTSNALIISKYAPDILDILGNMLEDKNLANEAVGRLFIAGTDESSSINAPDAETKALVDAARTKALELVRNAICPKKLKSDAIIKFYQARSYQDFDDSASDSPKDDADLAKLAELLDKAIQENNTAQIQATATAIGSYQVEDNVGKNIIDLLTTAMSSNAASDVQMDIGYALEEISGVSLDLTPSGLAHFKEQWKEKYLTQRSKGTK